MNKSLPKVSIVLPTYNGDKYIRQSIDSCLNQTYQNIELIIVDDGSTEDIYKIIKSYKDKRIKYIRHEKNKGLPHALNTGFANSNGDYLTWTSDDNYYVKESIEKMVSFLESKKCSFIYCDYYKFKDEKPSKISIEKLPDVLAIEKINNVGACFLYSRKVKEAIGEYDPETVLAEDYDYWIRVSKEFSMHHLAEPLYFYRDHNKSLYRSKYYEVKIADVLVRMKNHVLDIDVAVDALSRLIARRYLGFVPINKYITKIFFSQKIRKELNSFKEGNLSFEEARLKLKDIVTKRLL